MNTRIKKNGFTLVEMLVTITVFLIIISSIIGLFIYGIQQQRRTLALRALLDQSSYTLEYMSRALRMASKEINDPPSCLSATGLNYENTSPYPGIKFINHLENDNCQEFYLEGGILKFKRDIAAPPINFSSANLEIVNLKFNLSGESQDDNLQPRVTIFVKVKVKNSTEASLTLNLQTSISQRALDVEY